MALVVVKRLSRNAASDECYTPCDQVLPILDYLDKGYTYENISKIIPCSRTTIVKVKRTREDLQMVHS